MNGRTNGRPSNIQANKHNKRSKKHNKAKIFFIFHSWPLSNLFSGGKSFLGRKSTRDTQNDNIYFIGTQNGRNNDVCCVITARRPLSGDRVFLNFFFQVNKLATSFSFFSCAEKKRVLD